MRPPSPRRSGSAPSTWVRWRDPELLYSDTRNSVLRRKSSGGNAVSMGARIESGGNIIWMSDADIVKTRLDPVHSRRGRAPYPLGGGNPLSGGLASGRGGRPASARHTGHVSAVRSHRKAHCEWKVWAQGSVTLVWRRAKSVWQTAHVPRRRLLCGLSNLRISENPLGVCSAGDQNPADILYTH